MTTATPSVWAVAALSILLGPAIANAGRVEGRGGEPALSGKVTKIDESGVTIERENAQAMLVRWDRIRNVELESQESSLTGALERFADDGTRLWRARSRLERGDAALAEPMFERLFETHRGRTDETALVVAEGLLRCRLARGAQDAAVIPAMETIRLRRNVRPMVPIYSVLSPLIDEQTSLCIALPPVWTQSAPLVRLERDLGLYDSHGDTIVAAQAALYRRAVQLQMGIKAEPDDRKLAADNPGIILLRAMVQAMESDSTKRIEARDRLERDVVSMPNWQQGWAHYVIGSSLMTESGVGRQQQGMVHLAYLPARYADAQPYLAAMALLRLVDTCEASGDSTAAASLRAELLTRFPNHPAAARTSPPATQTSQAIKESI